MKFILVVAVVLLGFHNAAAQGCNGFTGPSPWTEYVCVADVSVSDWDGCKGTLNVTLNTSKETVPLMVSDNSGKTCPAGRDTPYTYGCYMYAGESSISIPISPSHVDKPTIINLWAAVEYDDVPMWTSVLASPNCDRIKCPGCPTFAPRLSALTWE